MTAITARIRRFHSKAVMSAISFKPKGPEKQADGCNRSKQYRERGSLACYPWTHHGQKRRAFRNVIEELGGAFTLSDVHAINFNTVP